QIGLDLTLKRKIQLVRVRPMEAAVDSSDGGVWQEDGVGRTIGIRIRQHAPGKVPVRISQRLQVIELLASTEWLKIRGLIPFIGRHRTEVCSGGRSNRRFTVSERIPGESNTRSEIVFVSCDNAPRHARVTGKEQADRR